MLGERAGSSSQTLSQSLIDDGEEKKRKKIKISPLG